jgi:hypothetical protein
MRQVIAILVATTAVASADPSTDPVVVPTFQLATTMFDEPTPPPVVPSLRVEAARLAQERWEEQWRYPAPGELGGYDGTGIFFGHGHYRPRSSRSAKLHAGAVGATLLGEILLGTGSPLAGVGALATGAVLDGAAADADADAERQQPRTKR